MKEHIMEMIESGVSYLGNHSSIAVLAWAGLNFVLAAEDVTSTAKMLSSVGTLFIVILTLAGKAVDFCRTYIKKRGHEKDLGKTEVNQGKGV